MIETESKQILSAEEINNILNNEQYVLVDTRVDSYYNGFTDPKQNVKGHITGAIQFSAEWVTEIADSKLAKFVQDKGIVKSKNILVYDSEFSRAKAVYDLLTDKLNFHSVKIFTDLDGLAKLNNEAFVHFPGYKLLVSPDWVKQLIVSENPETYSNGKFKIFDTYGRVFDENRDSATASYAKKYENEHIPGAGLLNLSLMEGGPALNILAGDIVKAELEKLGITNDTTVVVYSINPSASFRTAFILSWAGVEDVRILNGGLTTWKQAGLPLESGSNQYAAVADFGAEVPQRPNIRIAHGEEAYRKQQAGLKLVSIRSWHEHTGDVQGYTSVPELADGMAVGEPADAIWGFSGSKIRHMEDYYDPDNTLRNPLEVEKLWQTQGVFSTDKIAFFCGTGWRACIAFFVSIILGWENARLYDGSWLDWQQNPELPLSKRDHAAVKPDAKNDFS